MEPVAPPLADQVRISLERGGQGGTIEAVAEHLLDGSGRIEIWEGGSLSWWYPEPGVCEIMHAYGRLEDADLALEALGTDMRAWGATRLEFGGRRGWGRVAASYGRMH